MDILDDMGVSTFFFKKWTTPLIVFVVFCEEGEREKPWAMMSGGELYQIK